MADMQGVERGGVAARPADHGFFGPGSVTWKVWSYPTSLTVGFQRAVVIEELDPFLVAPVDHTAKIFTKPRQRYDNTLKYFATVAFADSGTAVRAAEMLTRIHAQIHGLEPVSGRPYDANDPAQQLWIHLTAWHSILYAYERFGPGRLTGEEESRYWEECAIAAELQTCAPSAVPRTREGIRRYFEAMRPRLAASEATQYAMEHLLDAHVMYPRMWFFLRPGGWVISRGLRAATLATMPRWQLRLAGIRQSRLTRALIVPVMRLSFHVAALSVTGQLALLKWISPATHPVVEPVLRDVPPHEPVTRTPGEAFAANGVRRPGELHAEFVARRTMHPVPDLPPSAPMAQPIPHHGRRPGGGAVPTSLRRPGRGSTPAGSAVALVDEGSLDR
ncbi:oxygenase MpaB family protein [Gordonia aurantiaca]|uniref:oxygenase MpaB family protein n=1 Tax=Gordonia sp. B21 TaxID=3151852 RepID=UPI003264FD5C